MESQRLCSGYQGRLPGAATASVASTAERRVARCSISTTSRLGNQRQPELIPLLGEIQEGFRYLVTFAASISRSISGAGLFRTSGVVADRVLFGVRGGAHRPRALAFGRPPICWSSARRTGVAAGNLAAVALVAERQPVRIHSEHRDHVRCTTDAVRTGLLPSTRWRSERLDSWWTFERHMFDG